MKDPIESDINNYLIQNQLVWIYVVERQMSRFVVIIGETGSVSY